MRFESVATGEAEGALLAHSVRAGGRLYRKGRVLTADDIGELARAGVRRLTVARLEADDVHEDAAAVRVAARLAGANVRASAPFAGRVNLHAERAGLALIDAAMVDALNAVDEAITLATVTPFVCVTPRQMLATVKIIPYAAPAAAVEKVEALLAEKAGAIAVAAFRPKQAGLIVTTLPGMNKEIPAKTRAALAARMAALGGSIAFERECPHDEAALARALGEAAEARADPIAVFGASAIADRRDVIPAAILKAGGTIEHFGMPVDPGNLLLAGMLHGVPVIGLPGCARSPKLNGLDFVLQRLCAGLPVGRTELVRMGVGGLLKEIAVRPQPREERAAPARAPRVAAIVLAAGLSSRMAGRNKLLAMLNGQPLVRHAVAAAAASMADPVIVVTGHEADAVEGALRGMQVRFARNPAPYAGLGSSLRCGLAAIPGDADAAVVLLGDMPRVRAHNIDKLIAAFDPGGGRAICVPVRHGKRGNPVLWGARFFSEMMAIEGDTGAKHLMGVYPDLVCEVEMEDDATQTDIDTPEALAAAAKP